MKFMCDVAKVYVCGLGVGVLLASSGLAHGVQPKGAKISAQTLVAIKKAVEVVQQENFSAQEKQLLGFVPGLCAGVSELDAVAYAVTGRGFDYTSTHEALAYLAKKVAAAQETAPRAVKESYGMVAAALDTLQAEFAMVTNGCVPDDARSVTIDLSSVLEKLNEIQAMLSDIIALIEDQSDASESCCEQLNSLLEIVIANEETLMDAAAALQTAVSNVSGIVTNIRNTVNTIDTTTEATETTVNTINTTTTTTNTTVGAINTTATATNTTVGAINTTVNTINTTATTTNNTVNAIQTTVNTINTTATTTNTTVNNISTTVNATDSKIDVLQSAVDEIMAGDCTPIYNDGANTIVIDSPGTFCLAENVGLSSGDSVVISITSDDVVLNLNGFEVFSLVSSSTGIEVNGASSVVIKNGTVRSNTTTGVYGILVTNGSSEVTIDSVVVDSWKRDTTSAGIKIENSVVVNIDEVTVYGSGLGLYGNNSENITVRNSSSSSNYGSGFYFNGCTGISMSGAVANNNGSSESLLTLGLHSGIALQSSNVINFVNCMAQGNAVTGFYFKTVVSGSAVGCCAYETANSSAGRGGFTFDSCTALSCIDCVSSNNANQGRGFFLANNTDLVFRECISSLNNGGFYLAAIETNIILLGCQATQSVSGFAIVNPSTKAIVQGCQAFSNTIGFIAEDSTNQRYYGNVAFANTTNTSITTPPFIAAFVAPASATTWTANVTG